MINTILKPKTLKFNMSTKAMSAVMYAIIHTNAKLISSYCLGYEYTRAQNSRNPATIKIAIHPEMIDKFIELSGCELKDPVFIEINRT